jgi:hypothetical protein
MSKTLQELTAHFPAKWDEITIRATKDQFIIKKCDEILHDGLKNLTKKNHQKICLIFR